MKEEDILKGYGGIAMGVMAREKETEAKEFDYEMEVESLQKQIDLLYGNALKLELRIERLEADALLMVETMTKMCKALK